MFASNAERLTWFLEAAISNGLAAVNDTDPYQVRPAGKSDAQAVLHLSRLWAVEGCTTGYIPCKAEHLKSWLEGGYFFVAEFNGDVIAYAAGVEELGKGAIFKPEGERYLNVDEVFVHADHRDRGVGTQLMQTLLEKAQAEGVLRSMVGSNNVDWLSTFQFYERHGYRMFAIQMYK